MTTNNYPAATNGIDAVAQMGKDVDLHERRGSVRVASDIMGPGLAPTAVQVTDWGGQETLFNGIFFSLANQSTNSPDGTKNWMGEVYAVSQGFGYQILRDMATGSPYRRTWTVAGDATRIFTAWTQDVVIPAQPQSVAIVLGGPWNTVAPPNSTTGFTFTCGAGRFRGLANASAFTTSGAVGLNVAVYVDGVLRVNAGIAAALTANVHTTLVPGPMDFQITAGTHYVYYHLTAGSSDGNDRGSFYGVLTNE